MASLNKLVMVVPVVTKSDEGFAQEEGEGELLTGPAFLMRRVPCASWIVIGRLSSLLAFFVPVLRGLLRWVWLVCACEGLGRKRSATDRQATDRVDK